MLLKSGQSETLPRDWILILVTLVTAPLSVPALAQTTPPGSEVATLEALENPSPEELFLLGEAYAKAGQSARACGAWRRCAAVSESAELRRRALSSVSRSISPYGFGDPEQAAGPIGWTAEATRGEKLERILDAWALDEGFMGSVVAVFDHQIALEKGFGFASLEHGVQNSVATRFPLPFLSRQVTEVAIGLLVEEGRLAFGDPLGKHLPGLAPHVARVAVRYLIEARSGLEQDLFRYTEKTHHDHFPRLGELAELAGRVEVRTAPGERYSLSGPEGVATDAILLGALIEKLSGERFEDFVLRRIFEPLAMSDSGFLTKTRLVESLARPYQRLFGELEPHPSTDYSYLRTSGAVYATAADVARFLRGVVERGVLGKVARQALEMGLGRRELTLADGRLTAAVDSLPAAERHVYLDNNGWTRGTTILLSYFPDCGDLLLVLSNVHRAAEIYDLRRRFMRLAFGLPVGMPLPKTAEELWRRLREDGIQSAHHFFEEHRALGSGPDLPFPDEFMHHSRELRRRGRFDEALLVTELYLSVQPDFWLPYREMGEVHRQRGDTAAALRFFRQALAMEVDDPAWKADMEEFVAGHEWSEVR